MNNNCNLDWDGMQYFRPESFLGTVPCPEEGSQPIDYSFAGHDSGVSFADCSVGSPESSSNGSDIPGHSSDISVPSELSEKASSPKNEIVEEIELIQTSSPICEPEGISKREQLQQQQEQQQKLQKFQFQ